jgi:FkbM family methyltransferase
MIETIEYNGRRISYDGSGKEHMMGGEGPIMAKYFDIKPNEVFVDVGAADSQWTLYALASGAYVYAIEPSVPYFKKLVQDVLANDPPAMACADAQGFWQPDYGMHFFERCKLLNVGLGLVDRVERLCDWYARIVGPGDGLCSLPDTQAMVRFLPLDHFLPELHRFDWMKIDVEGGELDVMEGGRQAIEKFKPNFIIENHSQIDRMRHYMSKERVIERIYEWLRSLGYNLVEDTHQQTAGRTFIVARSCDR